MNITINNYQFINFKDDNININFSTAKNNLDFNMTTSEGISNLENIKNWFRVKEVGYLKQTHSDNIHSYDGTVKVGDAIITDKNNTAIGVFTADCVPVLIYSKDKGIIAAVHSGWKGTFLQIVYKTLVEIINRYSAKEDDIKVYIGPHNKGCCYEFGKQEADLFYKVNMYKNISFYENGNLNLQRCITEQIIHAGIPKKNIIDLDICTFCNDKYELFSYRKQKMNYGRMFSFIYMD